MNDWEIRTLAEEIWRTLCEQTPLYPVNYIELALRTAAKSGYKNATSKKESRSAEAAEASD